LEVSRAHDRNRKGVVGITPSSTTPSAPTLATKLHHEPPDEDSRSAPQPPLIEPLTSLPSADELLHYPTPSSSSANPLRPLPLSPHYLASSPTCATRSPHTLNIIAHRRRGHPHRRRLRRSGLEGRGRGDIRKRVGGGTSHTMRDNV
jgi:hypothetical protein